MTSDRGNPIQHTPDDNLSPNVAGNVKKAKAKCVTTVRLGHTFKYSHRAVEGLDACGKETPTWLGVPLPLPKRMDLWGRVTCWCCRRSGQLLAVTSMQGKDPTRDTNLRTSPWRRTNSILRPDHSTNGAKRQLLDPKPATDQTIAG